MLAGRFDHTSRRKPFPYILLRTLSRSLRSFSECRPLFSITCGLFLQNTRVGGTRQNSPFPINLQTLLTGLPQTGGQPCLPQPGILAVRSGNQGHVAACYSAPAFLVLPSFRNVPFSSSVKAWRSCSCVFMTMGPYQATGSSRGLPETRRKRMPSAPACTMTSSPRSNSTSERLSAAEGGAVSSHPTDSVGTERGSLALQNFPEPAKTYAKAWRVVSTGRAFLRPGATETSTYTGSVAMPSTGPRLPQKLPHTSRTCVPSSSVISGISGDFTSW